MSTSGRPGRLVAEMLRASDDVSRSSDRFEWPSARAEGAVGPPPRFTPNPGRRKGNYGHVDAPDAAPLVVAGPYSPLAPPLHPGRSRRAEAVGPSVDVLHARGRLAERLAERPVRVAG